MDLKNEIKQFLKRGSFPLASGQTANLYLDLKESYGSPILLNAIAESLYEKMPSEINCIAGMGLGAEIPAAVISSKYGKNLTIIRGEIKNHGTKSLIEGYVPKRGDLVAIVDDVFTTGGSLRKAIEILNKTETKIEGCYVVIKRGEGTLPVPLAFLYTLDDLL
ncbi:MAG TPA: phosphoribosyltransferase family protein [Candidatus Nanoarchaeia archaeon]|nr:phosphoribosyltransferase family protein [Candidatus Nanoarchaeia archaeon]